MVDFQFRLVKFGLKIAYNDLLIGDGRDTEALNCKPNTNL
jgi:hypothetical protein